MTPFLSEWRGVNVTYPRADNTAAGLTAGSNMAWCWHNEILFDYMLFYISL
jgi:hypothetical protein